MSDQPSLLLETTCACGRSIPYSGVGRPRTTCDQCRPASSLPPVKKVPEAVSRYVTVREHKRRVTGADVSPIPRHRVTDPETSAHAAGRVAGQGVEAEILAVFARLVELTDDELVACLPDRYGPTVRTARSRLSKAGHLHDSGTTRLSARGHAQIVWRVNQ